MDDPPNHSRTAACLVTPPGSGGIAVIEVRGPRAADAVAAVFAPKSGCAWRDEPAGRLHYGHVLDGDAVVDEVLVCVAARDGAGQVVEVNCHGGIVTAAEIMRLLVGAGATEARPDESVERAAGECEFDAVQAEALAALPRAHTRLAARMLCDQLGGALSDALRAIRPDAPGAADALGALASSAAFGRALVTPRRVALVGSPNAGKSTLFNALVGHHRTIVSPTPGTTRDFVNEFIVLGGYPVELVDTAGLRRQGDVVEMKGVEAAWQVASEADVLVLLVDGAGEATEAERELAGSLAPQRPLIVGSKSDLATGRGGSPDAAECVVSAATGDGLAALEAAILARLPDASRWPAGSAVAFTARHEEVLRDAARLARAGQAKAAGEKVGELLVRRP